MDKPRNEQQANKTKVVCPICGQEFETQEEHDKHHREAHDGQQTGQA